MTIQEGAHGGQVVEAGGRLLLALPVGGDLVRYNMHRVYGPLRLPLLLENWTVLGAQGFDAAQLSQVSWPLVCHLGRSSRPFRRVASGALPGRWVKSGVSCALVSCALCDRNPTQWPITSPCLFSKTRHLRTSTRWCQATPSIPCPPPALPASALARLTPASGGAHQRAQALPAARLSAVTGVYKLRPHSQ